MFGEIYLLVSLVILIGEDRRTSMPGVRSIVLNLIMIIKDFIIYSNFFNIKCIL